MSPGDRGRSEARCQRRLVNFVRPQLQSDEDIVAILSRSSPGNVALVVTNHRLFEIGVGPWLSRPKEILATYPSAGVTVEWVPDTTRQTEYNSPAGRLSVTGPFGTRDWHAHGWHQFHASAVALALDPRLRRPLFESGDESPRPQREE
jgi:hypothetical protein